MKHASFFALTFSVLLFLPTGRCSSLSLSPNGSTFTQMNAPTHSKVLYDAGLQMNISTYYLPEGWQIDADIRTTKTDYTRFYSRYKFDIHGTAGEVVRNVAPVRYTPYLGESTQKVWHQSLVQQLAPFGQFQGGQLTQSDYGSYLFPELVNIQGIQFIQSYVHGTRNGRAFEGLCIGILFYGEYSAMFSSVLILSPKGFWEQTVENYRWIRINKVDNPQYQQTVARLNQQKNQKSSQNAQLYMSVRQQQFDSWQKSHQATVNAYAQSNAQFNQYLKGDYSSGSGQMNSNEAFNNYLQDVTAFDDSYLGYRVKQSGHYDYWFTNGSGEYYGTNDPGFDPYHLGSDWARTYPVR